MVISQQALDLRGFHEFYIIVVEEIYGDLWKAWGRDLKWRATFNFCRVKSERNYANFSNEKYAEWKYYAYLCKNEVYEYTRNYRILYPYAISDCLMATMPCNTWQHMGSIPTYAKMRFTNLLGTIGFIPMLFQIAFMATMPWLHAIHSQTHVTRKPEAFITCYKKELPKEKWYINLRLE